MKREQVVELDAVGTKCQIAHKDALFNIELHERQMVMHERSSRLHLDLQERSSALQEKILDLHVRSLSLITIPKPADTQ